MSDNKRVNAACRHNKRDMRAEMACTAKNYRGYAYVRKCYGCGRRKFCRRVVGGRVLCMECIVNELG